jgi:hypothetical protein
MIRVGIKNEAKQANDIIFGIINASELIQGVATKVTIAAPKITLFNCSLLNYKDIYYFMNNNL